MVPTLSNVKTPLPEVWVGQAARALKNDQPPGLDIRTHRGAVLGLHCASVSPCGTWKPFSMGFPENTQGPGPTTDEVLHNVGTTESLRRGSWLCAEYSQGLGECSCPHIVLVRKLRLKEADCPGCFRYPSLSLSLSQVQVTQTFSHPISCREQGWRSTSVLDGGWEGTGREGMTILCAPLLLPNPNRVLGHSGLCGFLGNSCNTHVSMVKFKR